MRLSALISAIFHQRHPVDSTDSTPGTDHSETNLPSTIQVRTPAWWAAATFLGLALLVVAVTFSIQLRLSHGHLPVPAGDAFWFYPVAKDYALHRVLANPFESPLSATDFRFRWHGWTYPYVLAWLSATLRWPLFTCDLLFVGFNTAFALLLLGVFIRFEYESPKNLIGLALVLPPLYLYCLGMAGRPELLALPLVIAIVISTSKWLHRPMLLILTCGSSFGLLMCTQPTVCILAALLWVSYVIAVLPPRDLLPCLTGIMVLSLTLSAVLTQLVFPYGLLDWLSGLAAHARILSSRSKAESFVEYFLFNLRQPLAGLWIALFIGASYRLARSRSVPGVQAGPLTWVMLGGVAAFSWFVGVRLPQTSYNLFLFIPLMMVIVVAAALRFDHAIGIWSVLLVLSIAALLSLSRLVVEGIWSKQHGTSYAHFRTDVLARIPPGATVAVHNSFVIALMDANPPFTIRRLELARTTCDYLIEAQANSGRLSPPTLRGFTLIQDTYARRPLRILGVTVLNTPKAYNFALYVRSGP